MQTIGSQGRLLRFGAYKTPGTFTWNLQPDVGYIVVEVVGGGGSGSSVSNPIPGNAGGTSSFSTFCSASGGGRAGGASAGVGGTGTVTSGAFGSGYTINGGNGVVGSSNEAGGPSTMGSVGRGGQGSGGAGGGGGGYAKQLIKRSELSSTMSLVVGAGGTSSIASSVSGANGIVIIHEYSL